MTGIVSNTYISNYTQNSLLADRDQKANENNATHKQAYAPATSVTLSEAAQAILAAGEQNKSADSGEEALTKMQDLLERLGRSSPMDGEKLAVDLSSFSRQEIFAISNNSGNMFTAEEQKAADIEREARFDAALKGGNALRNITGDYTDLYENALEYMEGAGADEKKSTEWQAQYAALTQAMTSLEKSPTTAPKGIANDPVASYLKRVEDGTVSENKTITTVAAEARTVLDSFANNEDRMEGLSDFGSRSLSAIATNVSDQFTRSEVNAAKHEMKARLSASVQSAFQQSRTSEDPSDFSKRLISQYSSMTSEEREAAGLDDRYYNTLTQNYQTSQSIAQMLNMGSSNSGTSSSSGSMSLLDFL